MIALLPQSLWMMFSSDICEVFICAEQSLKTTQIVEQLRISCNYCVRIHLQEKECIPVGRVPPQQQPSAVGRRVCLSACWDTPPWAWAWRPPLDVSLEIPHPPHGCGPGDPHQARPLNFSSGCGPEDPPPSQTPQAPPWVWAWKPARHAGIHPSPGDLQGMLGYHLHGMLGYPLPCGQTDTCKNITFANFVCRQ